MTEHEIRKTFVQAAERQLGASATNGTHKPIIDIYNGYTPLPEGYKVKYTDNWCATYVSAIGIMTGLADIVLRECSCGRMIALYQKAKRWMENDAYVPQMGDIIMYDWDDDAKNYATTDNTGWPEHVGIVVSVAGNAIKVIEGNNKKAVNYRSMQINGLYIRGYCLPDFASKATPEGSEKVEKRYNSVKEIEADGAMSWGAKDIQTLVDFGWLKGSGNGLDLSVDMIRVLIIIGRAIGVLKHVTS